VFRSSFSYGNKRSHLPLRIKGGMCGEIGVRYFGILLVTERHFCLWPSLGRRKGIIEKWVPISSWVMFLRNDNIPTIYLKFASVRSKDEIFRKHSMRANISVWLQFTYFANCKACSFEFSSMTQLPNKLPLCMIA